MKIHIATAAAGLFLCVNPLARATVAISSAPTQNMSCVGGTCTPTATDATLNVGDLQTLLASGSLTVTTTGSGVQADDIAISAQFGWSKPTVLTLDAFHSVAIGNPVKVGGKGGVSLITNDGGSGGTFSFAGDGKLIFKILAGTLSINGASYQLVNSVAALAAAIASSPSGNFALSQSYDAGLDGTYGSSPVGTQFSGSFQGDGNAISNLTINDPASNDSVGLFRYAASASIGNLNLNAVSVTGVTGTSVGGLAGTVGGGTVWGVHVSGTVTGGDGCSAGGLAGEALNSVIAYSTSSARVAGGGNLQTAVGGLVGAASSTIVNSWSSGGVTGSQGAWTGGLVGITSGGSISLSFATGQTEGGGGSYDGGLVGENGATAPTPITNSYATGDVSNGGGGGPSATGGLIGDANTPAATSYASGIVAGTNIVGGFVGNDNTGGQMAHDYWDTTTSGVLDKTQGAGNIPNDAGIKGLGNKKFKSGLPAGFDPGIWTESKGINGGLPYLISNPPP